MATGVPVPGQHYVLTLTGRFSQSLTLFFEGTMKIHLLSDLHLEHHKFRHYVPPDPRGYPGERSGVHFNPGLVIEI